MATRATVLLEDDLDGGEAGETVAFGLDGNAFEIDLSAKNATKLRKAFAAYITAGRRVGRASTRPRSHGAPGLRTGSASDAAAIRLWAQDNGYDMSSRGRIPAEIREAYAASR